jgi:hypothetical protein
MVLPSMCAITSYLPMTCLFNCECHFERTCEAYGLGEEKSYTIHLSRVQDFSFALPRNSYPALSK